MNTHDSRSKALRIKAGVLAICAVVSMSSLAGCGDSSVSDSQSGSKINSVHSQSSDDSSSGVVSENEKEVSTSVTEVDNVIDLIASYKAASHDSYRINGKFSFRLDMTDSDGSLNLQSEQGFDMSVTDAAMHGTITGTQRMSVNMNESSLDDDITDSSQDSDFEIYAIGGDNDSGVYFRNVSEDADDDSWYYSNNLNGMFVTDYLFFDLNPYDFEDAEFELKDGIYTVSQPLDAMMNGGGTFGSIVNDAVAAVGSDVLSEDEAFKSATASHRVIYQFDADTFDLLSVSLDKFSYSGESDSASFDFDIGLDITLGDYGDITENDTAVPDEVKTVAIDLGNAESSDELSDGE